MSLTTSTAANILKNRYIGPIRDQLEGNSILYNEIKKAGKENLTGKNWTIPLRTRRNTSAGVGRAENTTLQSPKEQGYSNAIIPYTQLYTRIEISGPAFEAMKDNLGAFARAFDSEATNAGNDMVKMMNWQLHGDGTGALAFHTAADNSTTFDLDDAQGNPFINLAVGQVVDIVDASDNSTLLLTAGEITTVAAPGAATVTVGASGSVSGTADGDYWILSGSLGYSLMGIRGIISASNPTLLSGGLHGIPVSGNNFWRAQVFSNSGVNRALTTLLMRRVMSTIFSNSPYRDRDVKLILCSPEVADEYYNVVVTDRRQVNTLNLDGGFKGLDFSGVPVVADPDCRKNTMYFIIPDTMKFYELGSKGLDWMDNDGSTLHRREDKDMFTATLRYYGNLGTDARNGNGVLNDIALSAS